MTKSRRLFLNLIATTALVAVSSFTHAQSAAKVELKTSMGPIVIELDEAKAPKTVANFLNYVRSGHYDGTIFHRVINGFMIQGGGFLPNMEQKPTRAGIENEAKNGLKNQRYTIAMARTNAPHSATSQFFINVNDNASLNYPAHDGWGYAVFGKVVEGKEIVDTIKSARTGNAGFHGDVPLTPILIESAREIK